MRMLAVLLLAIVAAAGCRTVRATEPIERPALQVPPPPPRVLEPVQMVATQPELVPDLPPEPVTTPAPAKPRPPAQSSAQTSREAPRPEPAKTDVPVEPAVAQNQPQAAPPPVLRTPATADVAASARLIRETISRAQQGLDNVDYRRLTPERQKDYDHAKDFITSAENTMKASNFELAKEFADKAEKLARELAGR